MQHASAGMRIVKDESVLHLSDDPMHSFGSARRHVDSTVVVVDTPEMPDTFPSITSDRPTGCCIDCVDKTSHKVNEEGE
jgi:hypothetical protein